jgi:hypothetical protein
MCGFQIPCQVPNCKPEDEICIKQKLVDEHWGHPSGFCSCRRWVFGNSVSIIRQKLLAIFWFEVRSWECEEDDGLPTCVHTMWYETMSIPKRSKRFDIPCTWLHHGFCRSMLLWLQPRKSCVPWHAWICLLMFVLSSPPTLLCQCCLWTWISTFLIFLGFFGL